MFGVGGWGKQIYNSFVQTVTLQSLLGLVGGKGVYEVWFYYKFIACVAGDY